MWVISCVGNHQTHYEFLNDDHTFMPTKHWRTHIDLIFAVKIAAIRTKNTTAKMKHAWFTDKLNYETQAIKIKIKTKRQREWEKNLKNGEEHALTAVHCKHIYARTHALKMVLWQRAQDIKLYSDKMLLFCFCFLYSKFASDEKAKAKKKTYRFARHGKNKS